MSKHLHRLKGIAAFPTDDVPSFITTYRHFSADKKLINTKHFVYKKAVQGTLSTWADQWADGHPQHGYTAPNRQSWPDGNFVDTALLSICRSVVSADMGTTQSRIMSRIRIKCFRLSHELIWMENLEAFESWVDLNQYLRIYLNHGLILSHFLESRLSHELNRFKSPRFFLNHELIQINLSGRHLSWKPKKGHTESTLEQKAQKYVILGQQ